MGRIRFQVSVSLDGYLAGPDQSLENPLGVGGEELHAWAIPLAAFREIQGETGGEVNASSPVVAAMFDGVGAVLMGRNMFGGGHGPWPEDPPWKGWWGDNPPYHMPVFVLTHHPREPLVMEGGTTFHFVTDGLDAALARAREAAGDRDVLIGGGASTIRQALAAGVVDEFWLSIVPLLLGSGERLLDGLPTVELEQVRTVEAPGVTHVAYRVVR
jgi:dihydrofolate reductase